MKSTFWHLVSALIVCIVVLVGYGIWYGAITAKSAVVADLQNQIDAKTETAHRITAARATLAGIAGDEATVQNFFVPESGVVAFIDVLEKKGKVHGAAVSVSSVATAGTPAQPTIAFAFTIEGTFDAVMRTVGSIEYAPYDLSVSALSLSQGDKRSWHADIKLLVGSVPAARSSARESSTIILSLLHHAHL